MENPSTPVRRLTYQDLCRLPDDGLRHELIDGVHYVSPAPKPRHQRAAGRLHLWIGNYLEEHPIGSVYFAPLDVLFSEYDCVEPDLLYLSREREERQMTDANLEGCPDLAIEILSPGTRHVDLGAKLRLYERFGVPEYWILDPERKTARVYRQAGGRLVLVEELSIQEAAPAPALSTPLLPGLSIPLDRIFD